MCMDLATLTMPVLMDRIGGQIIIATDFTILFTSDIPMRTLPGDGILAGVTAGVDIMVTAIGTLPITLMDTTTTTVLIIHVKWLIMQDAETAILIVTGIPKLQKAVFPEYRDIPTPVT